MIKLKFIIIALPVLLVITGCSTEEKIVRPTAVLDSAPDVPYGKPGESQRVLRKAGEMVRSAYTELNTLDISSDYLNVRDPEITFSETWSSAWGVGTLFLIAVDSEPDRIIFTTKDSNAVCWILQIKVSKDKEIAVLYGASTDDSCRASDVPNSKLVTWSEGSFPVNPQSNTPIQKQESITENQP